MRLKQLIKVLHIPDNYPQAKDFQVKGIVSNSKQASDNFIFAAIKGTHEDGAGYISEALEKGAKAVIIDRRSCLKSGISRKAALIAVDDVRKALAELCAEFYGRPSSKLKVVGVTGTNGKTTTTYLIEALLKKAEKSPAVIGTVNYRFKNKIIPAKNTTPGPIELQSLLARMLEAGIDYALMEVSSHALEQERTAGIDFHSAIFTNLTQDHLDYHKTLKNYFKAKAKLFKNMNSRSFAVVNNDDKHAKGLRQLTKAQIVSYGIKEKAQLSAKRIEFDSRGSRFLVLFPGGEFRIKSPLIGMHNVYNMLAGAAWAHQSGIAPEIIKSAFSELSFLPGRLERIDTRREFRVFVDYAHTEDALRNMITTLRPLSKKRIIVVFGCGGERDRGKRPKMGSLATRLADYAIITDDNPRSEDPEKIFKDIKKGIRKKNYCVIPGRMQAIKKSLELAGPGDIVLVAGKGHEDYQILKERVTRFDDREAVRECLRQMK